MQTKLQNTLLSAMISIAGLLIPGKSSAQFLPNGDVVTGTWTTTPLWSKVDDVGSSFISSPSNAQTTGEVSVQDPIEEGIYSLVTVNFLLRKSQNGGAVRGLTANIRVNGTLIESKVVSSDLTSSFVEYSVTWGGLNFTHTDLNTLQIQFTTTGTITTGGNARNVQIDYIEVILPEPAPLPVKLKTFNATRKQSLVELNWVTAMEQNNSGFELQRNTGAGGWQTIEFISSQSTDGNSQSELSYYYTDANNARGVSQYRLKQIDFDNKFEYSAIRAVHGMSQSGKTLVFPNPSANGTLNILFESQANRDLQLTDMVGRLIRQWNNYTDNSLQIPNLSPGSYQLKIIDRDTKLGSVEKVIVINR